MGVDSWTIYWTFVAFVFGAIVGSFLNVCIWRLPRDESLWEPPSHCPSCGSRLRIWPDMVPMFSQLWFRSRCRHCGTHFSWRYFWVELLTASTFGALYVRYVVFSNSPLLEGDRTLAAICGMAFAGALIAIFFIDLEHYQIPDIAVLVALTAGLLKDMLLIVKGARPLSEPVLGTIPMPLSIVGGLVAFWLLWQFAALATAALGKEAMGAGDSLLLAAMGAFLIPWPLVVLSFLLAVALGTAGGVIGMWLAHRAAPAAAFTEEETVAEAYPEVESERAPEASQEFLPLEETEETEGTEATEPTEATEAQVDTAQEGPMVPELPAASRWGRLWAVLGTWVAVGAVWGGAAAYREWGIAGLAVGAVAGVAAAALIRHGVRLWVSGDREWLPAMDEFFEGDPGPRFIPFGPYLVTGSLIAMLFGKPMIAWYLGSQLGMGPTAIAALGWD